jgi:acyl-CoA thioester hydrolase
VTEVSCRYLRPARYDEEIIIETTLTSLGRATLTFSYSLFRQKDEAPVVTGWTKHACVNKVGEVIRIPSDLDTTLKGAIFRRE